MTAQIRLATPADLSAINGIYNHYVRTSTCTYQEEESTAQERAEWLEAHGRAHPVTVAVDEAGQVVAWAALSKFHPRSAYRMTVENAVYVRHDRLRQGLGRLLLADLMQRAKALGHRQVIALISAEQAGSLQLHRRAGFVEVGRLRQVGFKFKQLARRRAAAVDRVLA